MSCSIALRRSPKPGALTATLRNVPRILLTTSVASASPSTSSAMITSGLPDWLTFSSTGSMSLTAEIFEFAIRMYGSSITASIRSGSVTKYGEMNPLSNRMPSTNSSSMPKVLDSSTVMTPSLPTLSTASAIWRPISASAAEIAPTFAISSLPSTSLERFLIASTARSVASSIPRLSAVGLAPAATLRRPSFTIACARTVAVVVPSPATSSVFFATSFTSSAPTFSSGSSSSISFAIDTPSFVIVGAPHFFSRTTLRPLGPNVILTALAS